MHHAMESVFPNVEMEKSLKSGEHGSVHLVRDKETKTRYIYREFSGSGEVYQKLQEIGADNLPKVFQLKEQDGWVYVLEEYIQGDTLAFLLEAGPLNESYAKEFALQLCHALGILHRCGIVHRDIKPENVMIRGTEAVLIDFDAARQVKPESRSDTQIMGTTGYAVPEQYGFSQTDARADIYSLGIVLNEMLTTQHPSKQLAQGIFRPVIERCTEMNVDKRYQAAEELYAAIQSSGVKTKKKRIGGLVLASVAAVLLLYAGFRAFSGGSRQAAQAPAVFEPERVELPPEQWAGPAAGYMTPFLYDADGDGEKESYEFGIYQADIPEGFRNTLQDYFVLNQGEASARHVYPCVWQYKEDGTLEVVGTLTTQLTDPKIQVYRTSEEMPMPEAYTAEGPWQSGLQVIYTYDNLGTWVYDIQAKLGEQSLTAVACSVVDSYENYMKNQ